MLKEDLRAGDVGGERVGLELNSLDYSESSLP